MLEHYEEEKKLARKATLKKGLTVSVDNLTSAILGKQPVTSGINNQVLIGKVTSKLTGMQNMMDQVTGGMETLYELVIKTMSLSEKFKNKRVEPGGVHFVEVGEVLVIGQQMKPLMRLSKCDAFGLCSILRQPGPEFLGDLRAGIRPAQTFYISYKDIKKRLSIPERIALKRTDGNAERFEGVINYVKSKNKDSKEKFDAAKLRRY